MMTRTELFDARNVADLFDRLGKYIGRTPTVRELRTWTNTVLGPWAIPADVREKCAPPVSA